MLLAVLGVVVLVVAVLALRHPKNSGTSAGTSSPQRSVTSSVSSSPPKTVATSPSVPAPSSRASSSHASAAKRFALVVLNNSTIPKLADTATAQFRAGGWTVTRFGNYTVRTISTAAYYDPHVSGSKKAALALQRQFPKIRRVLTRYSQLPSGPIVVVLTSGYASG